MGTLLRRVILVETHPSVGAVLPGIIHGHFGSQMLHQSSNPTAIYTCILAWLFNARSSLSWQVSVSRETGRLSAYADRLPT